MKGNKLALKLSLIYTVVFLGISCTFPYLTLYMQDRGLNSTQIGIVYGFLSIITIFAQPTWGYITDKYSNKRTMLILLALLNSIMIFNFIFAKNFSQVLLSVILLAVFQSSIIPITDAYSYGIIEKNPQIQYGKVRFKGSIGYAFGALILGQLIELTGIINIIYYIYSVVMLIMSVAFYSMGYKDHRVTRTTIKFKDIKELLKDKRVSILLVAVIVGASAMGSNGTYMTILIQKTGGDVSQLGIMWFFLAMSTIPVMFFGNKIIDRFGELNLYIFSLSMFSLRFILDSLCTNFYMVLSVQLMESITFALYFMSVIQYLNRVAIAQMKTIAMTFFAASGGTGTLIGNLVGGIVIDRYGIFVFYRMIAAVSLVALALVLLLKKHDTKKYGEVDFVRVA